MPSYSIFLCPLPLTPTFEFLQLLPRLRPAVSLMVFLVWLQSLYRHVWRALHLLHFEPQLLLHVSKKPRLRSFLASFFPYGWLIRLMTHLYPSSQVFCHDSRQYLQKKLLCSLLSCLLHFVLLGGLGWTGRISSRFLRVR